MSPFQCAALVALGAASLVDVSRAARHRPHARYSVVRVLTYAAAAIAIIFPDAVQVIAVAVGIRRGSDLVLYTFVLTFLYLAFVFYALYRQLEINITRLIRRDALDRARRGTATSEQLPAPASAPRPDQSILSSHTLCGPDRDAGPPSRPVHPEQQLSTGTTELLRRLPHDRA